MSVFFLVLLYQVTLKATVSSLVKDYLLISKLRFPHVWVEVQLPQDELQECVT